MNKSQQQDNLGFIYDNADILGLPITRYYYIPNDTEWHSTKYVSTIDKIIFESVLWDGTVIQNQPLQEWFIQNLYLNKVKEVSKEEAELFTKKTR